LENCYKVFIDYTDEILDSGNHSLLETYLNLFDWDDHHNTLINTSHQHLD